MDTRSFIMKQRCRRLAVRNRRRREQLREMEEEHEAEQIRQRELEEQKQNIQTDSTIQDLEDMVMLDLSYNVSVNYYEKPFRYPGGNRYTSPRQDAGIKKHKPSFDIIKEQNLNPLLPDEQRKVYHRFTFASNMKYETQFRYKKLTDMVPFGIAETSDKFVAILNIVKQQNARIEEFERMFPVMSKRIIELERIVYDKDDSVVEERVNEEPPVEETNDELTSESDSDAEVESLPSYHGLKIIRMMKTVEFT